MNKKVLFVDDQEDILDLIKLRLKDEEYEKFFALNVEEALKILNNENIDVVITDIFMPGIGGHDFLEILKDKYPKIVRVILSGFSQVNSIVEAINSGDVYRYITKPWKVDEAGKIIIRDALKYSEFLNQKKVVSIDIVVEILKKCNIEFEITNISYEENQEKLIKLNDFSSLLLK